MYDYEYDISNNALRNFDNTLYTTHTDTVTLHDEKLEADVRATATSQQKHKHQHASCAIHMQLPRRRSR